MQSPYIIYKFRWNINKSQWILAKYNRKNYVFCYSDVIISPTSISSISGNSFSLYAANKQAAAKQRQTMDAITAMNRNILNMIAHQFNLWSKNKYYINLSLWSYMFM